MGKTATRRKGGNPIFDQQAFTVKQHTDMQVEKMADLNEDNTVSTDDSSSTEKVQIYTSVSKGNKAWLQDVAERKSTNKSDVLRKLVQNARVRDKDGEEIII